MTGGRVVVLGATGRNFGAGMSGGVAYIYDPKATFAADLNMEMVQLQTLTDSDTAFLVDVLQRHCDLTGSTVAYRIVAAWESEAQHFRKVMPTDYQRVLTVMAQAELVGLDEHATLDRVMESSRAGVHGL
jgi:glutamate synthase (NADPH/NADH) large chain